MSAYGTAHDTSGSSTRCDCTMLQNKSIEHACSDFLGEFVSVTQMRHAGGSLLAKSSSVMRA